MLCTFWAEERRSCPKELTWRLQATRRGLWCCLLSSWGQLIKENTQNHKHLFTTLICFHWVCVLPVLSFRKYCSSWIPMAKYLWKANFISWREVCLLKALGLLSLWRCWTLQSSAQTHVCLKVRCFGPDPWGSFPNPQGNQPTLKVDALLGRSQSDLSKLYSPSFKNKKNRYNTLRLLQSKATDESNARFEYW